MFNLPCPPGIPFVLAALLTWAASCAPQGRGGGSSALPAPGERAREATAGASAASAAPPPERPRSLALAQPRPEALDFEVWPTLGERFVLLVASDALGGWAHLRTLSPDGTLGPVRTLVGRQPVQGLWLERPRLLSSDGRQLCLEPLDGVERPHCQRLRADLAVVVDERLLLLEQRPPPDDEDAAEDKPKRKGKPSTRAPAAPKTIEMQLWVHILEPDGTLVESVDSGLAFDMPLPGMGLVDAVATRRGVRLLWYEHARDQPRGKRRVARARLRSALLDGKGKRIAKSTTTLFEGERGYGHIEGHTDPQLFARDGRAIYVGRFRDDAAKPPVAGWELLSLPRHKTIVAPSALVSTDPARLAQKRAVAPDERSRYQALADAKPRRLARQAIADAARVAWAGDLGVFLSEGELRQVRRSTGVVESLKSPFVASRAQLFWGGLAADGTVVALGSDGLVAVSADGLVETRRVDGRPGVRHAFGAPVKIGDSWWLIHAGPTRSGGQLERLLPSEQVVSDFDDTLYADCARLVGGRDRGLLLRWRAGWLDVEALQASGGHGPVAQLQAPFGPGFEAVERAGGGALVVGPGKDRSQLLAVAIDAGGSMGAAQVLGLSPTKRFELHALPGGGAVVFDDVDVEWLDPSAMRRAKAAWPQATAVTACLDGTPLGAAWPTPTPGAFQPLSAELRAGRCWVSAPRWTARGLSWVGTHTHELESQAEAVLLVGTAAAASDTTPAGGAIRQPGSAPAPTLATPACPADMVSIRGRYCIDRFEAQLIEGSSGVTLSPDYPPNAGWVDHVLSFWPAARLTTGDLHARAMPLPALDRAPDAQPRVVATSRAGVMPSGYLSGNDAAAACEGAGKRLCSHDEWVTACRGEQSRPFPYGDDYQHGICNVYRYAHPAATLHGNAAIGHLDPRLNRVSEAGAPLLQTTGASPRCASRWGDDAVYDMVGNLDEWVDRKGGAFAGGFYSRLTQKGCDAIITVHPKRYLDYSLGVRCCLDASRAPKPQ